MPEESWLVYMLLCRNGALYTGVTTDIERRVRQHNAGTGARYTKMNGPVRAVYLEAAASRSEALRREWAIKRLSRDGKRKLVESPENVLPSERIPQRCPSN